MKKERIFERHTFAQHHCKKCGKFVKHIDIGFMYTYTHSLCSLCFIEETKRAKDELKKGTETVFINNITY